MSTYIVDGDGNIAYQIERGLDMAISEYAPGCYIVVDKKLFKSAEYIITVANAAKDNLNNPPENLREYGN